MMKNSCCQAKYVVLFLLVVQNSVHVVLMRYTRTRPGTIYLASTAVCCDEAIKLFICLGILALTYYYEYGRNNTRNKDGIRYTQVSSNENNGNSNNIDREKNNGQVIDSKEGTIMHHHESFGSYLREQLQFDFRVAGIAGIFTIQKNLIYLAISNLDAVIFQVAYQGKILTTALFSVFLLKKKLSSQQVGGLLLLTVAVILVQLDKADENSSPSYQEQRRWVGLLATVCACLTSGFAGVYFELVLKPRNKNNPVVVDNGIQSSQSPPPPPSNPPSVWAKNVQLSTFALIIAIITSFTKDHQAIRSDGFFQGYNSLVVGVIVFQSAGGLIVAATIKYADNILKNFASASSIIGSAAINAFFFGFEISLMFFNGCLLIFISIWLYTKQEGNGAAQDGSEIQLTRQLKLSPQKPEKNPNRTMGEDE
eukprot:CAMPEP_0183739170 /NCGR_PEP_ID=MMETSP0737-20130205/56375_1 /TAXON_ID=385413 /ORGANISM="Thalassiosira miniscula, Strain CCMP1093" /LENGTH=422 /DNA_ID=CAMNT_0025973901 /DNA_START=212 /DNA_END=1477 /DNA_ORIENTATION=-